MPGLPPLDIVLDRRSHTRGISKSQTSNRIRLSLFCRTFTGYRRLVVRNERYPALHVEIWTELSSPFHREGTDSHFGINRKPSTRNRTFCSSTLLGIENLISGNDIRRHQREISNRSRGKRISTKIEGFPFTVTDITTKQGKEAPPRLFDLTSLQVECNKKFSFSAENTLKIIQSLYEKK